MSVALQESTEVHQVTLTLPQELAADITYLLKIASPEQIKAAAEAFADALDADISDEELGPLTPEDLEAIGRGYADADAGRVIDGKIAMAQIREAMQARREAAGV